MTISQVVLIDIAKLLEPNAFLLLQPDAILSEEGLLDLLQESHTQMLMLKDLIDAENMQIFEGYGEELETFGQELETFGQEQELELDGQGLQVLLTKIQTSLAKSIERFDAKQLQLQQAYLTILKEINPKYYATRDNPVKFAAVQKQITSLIAVVEHCRKEFSGELKDNPALAEQITQLHFKVSNYYSLAGIVDANNYDLCTEWLNKAGDFIRENGLVDTKVHAVWHNLIGGHQSRGFEMKKFLEFPHSAVEHFQEAVRIHTEKLGSKIDKVEDVDLRHVTMCLADVIVQEAIEQVILAKQVTNEVIVACTAATTLLDKLPDKVLVKYVVEEAGQAEIVPDNYRIADCSKVRAKIAFLHGNIEQARSLAKQAEQQMEAAVPKAPGQLALIHNIVTDFNYAYGRYKAIRAFQLCSGNLEGMYAQMAKANIICIKNKFANLTPIVMKDPGPWFIDRAPLLAQIKFAPVLAEIKLVQGSLRFSRPPLSQLPQLPPELSASIRGRSSYQSKLT